MTKQSKREAWLKQMADPKDGRYKSCWWAGSLTAAELEEWILELRAENEALYQDKLRAFTELGWAGEWKNAP